MSEKDLCVTDLVCPFCGSVDRKVILILQQEPTVALLYCESCHAASASRMPKPEALERYYSTYYDGKDEKITLDAPGRIAAHIYRHVRSTLTLAPRRNFSMLDYGGGDGSISTQFAAKLHDEGKAAAVHISLLDYDQSTTEVATQRLTIARPENLDEIHDQSMDLVIASAVIEHVPHPREVLIKLFSALKPGGVFYARTPYLAPLARFAGICNVKIDFTYPAHVHDLGSKFWNNITNMLPLGGEYQVIRSCPSIVETSFEQHFFRTLIAHVLKMPGYAFKETYGLVGGWEVFIRRNL